MDGIFTDKIVYKDKRRVLGINFTGPNFNNIYKFPVSDWLESIPWSCNYELQIFGSACEFGKLPHPLISPPPPLTQLNTNVLLRPKCWIRGGRDRWGEMVRGELESRGAQGIFRSS